MMTPQSLMRLRRGAIVWGIALAVFCWIGASALQTRMPGVAGALTILYIVALVSGLFLYVFGHFLMAAAAEKVLREGGLRCPRCGYALDGLAGEGACPECGVRYEHERVRAWWRGYRRFLLGQLSEAAPPSAAWWSRAHGWWKIPEWEYHEPGATDEGVSPPAAPPPGSGA